jgi:hypothetical protein
VRRKGHVAEGLVGQQLKAVLRLKFFEDGSPSGLHT